MTAMRGAGASRSGARSPAPADPPAIEEHPDISPAALQALRGDFLYFNVAGSGPTFPVAQRAAERFRTWLNEVGMFGQLGYAAYNTALDATRADVATALGDREGAARVALAQSATDGLNTLVAGLAIPPRSLILTTLEEHGSALADERRRERHREREREPVKDVEQVGRRPLEEKHKEPEHALHVRRDHCDRDRATETWGRARVPNAEEQAPEADRRVIKDERRGRTPVQRKNDIHS